MEIYTTCARCKGLIDAEDSILFIESDSEAYYCQDCFDIIKEVYYPNGRP